MLAATRTLGEPGGMSADGRLRSDAIQPVSAALTIAMSTLPRALFCLFALACWLPTGQAQPKQPETFTHTVQPGDTLIGVRNQLLRPDVRWQALQSLNRVPDPFKLKPGSVLTGPVDWLSERPAQAEVLQQYGTLWVERGGQRQALQAGAWLRDGDRLVTGEQSSATVRFADGSRSLVRPNTEVDLLALRQSAKGGRTALGLRMGSVDTIVPSQRSTGGGGNKPRFEIRTPVANLGVRGTQFRSTFTEQLAVLEVLEGQVQARVEKASKGTEKGVASGFGWRSDANAIETLPPAPDLSGLRRPAFERLPIQLEWPASPGAVAWRLQVSDAEGRLLLDETVATPQWVGGATLPDADYVVSVRGRSANQLEGRDALLPLALRARPEPPFLQQPAAQASSTAETQRFAWTRAAEAARYHWQLASDAGFANLLVERTDLSDPETTEPLPVGTHFWRVASVRGSGQRGPWSDPQSLTRLPPPPPASPPPPAEQQRDGKTLQLRWAASSLEGARYEVQVAQDEAFAKPWLTEQVDTPTLTLKPPSGGKHHVRIRTLRSDGTPGPWGSTQSFEWSQNLWWLWLTPLLLLAL